MIRGLVMFVLGAGLGAVSISLHEQADPKHEIKTEYILNTSEPFERQHRVVEIPASEVHAIRSPWGELLNRVYVDATTGWDDLPKMRPAVPLTHVIRTRNGESNLPIDPEKFVDKKDLRDGGIYDLILNLPEENVRDYFKRSLRIEMDELDQQFNLPELGQHMYNIGLSQTMHKTLNDSMVFGVDVNKDYTVKKSQQVFRDNPKRIYAGFKLPRKGFTKIIVKWHRMGDVHPFLYSSERVDPATENSYVYFEPYDDWRTGTYLVEIFDPGDLSGSVTGGLFFIEGEEPVDNNTQK